MPDNSSWGIEIGSNAIKAIRLVRQGQSIAVDTYADRAVQENLDDARS